MEDVVTIGTGTAVNFKTMPIAGKTGTTSDYRDVWFSGYTPYYTCTIWGGYDTNDKMSSSTSFQKVLWKNIMQRVHEGLPEKDFTIPDDIETAVICKKSGKLAVADLCDSDPRGSMVITEYFAKGTAPTEVCDTHIRLATCAISNLPAGPYCPQVNYNSDQIYIIRPTGAEGVTDDTPYELPSDYTLNICPIHTSPVDSTTDNISDPNYYYDLLPEYSPDTTDTTGTTDVTDTTDTTTDTEADTQSGSSTEAGINSIIDSTVPPKQPPNDEPVVP
jgi:penicillin-binding protein 1A